MENDKASVIVSSFISTVTQHKLSARRISAITHNMVSWRTIARVLHNHKHNKKAILCTSTLAQLDRVTIVLVTTDVAGVLTIPATSVLDRRANDLQYRIAYKRLYPN